MEAEEQDGSEGGLSRCDRSTVLALNRTCGFRTLKVISGKKHYGGSVGRCSTNPLMEARRWGFNGIDIAAHR